MKKTLSLFLMMVLLLSCIPFETSATNSDVTFQEKILQIDSLLDDRVIAYMNGNNEQVALINKQLLALGARDLSYAETANVLGRAANYETATETISNYQGHLCKTIILKPISTRSSLWYSDDVTEKWHMPNEAAFLVQVMSSIVYSEGVSAVPILSTVDTVYSAFSDAQASMSKYQIISNVKASYTYNCYATCMYVYFLNASESHYVLYARYAKTSGNSSATVYTADFPIDNDPSITVGTCTHSLAAENTDYGSLSVAYAKGQYGIYDSWANIVDIKGLENETVFSVEFPIPLYPGFA